MKLYPFSLRAALVLLPIFVCISKLVYSAPPQPKPAQPVATFPGLPSVPRTKADKEKLVHQKLNSIILPELKLKDAKLSKVIPMLNEVSVLFDNSKDLYKGVNMFLDFDRGFEDPVVNLDVRKATLGNVLFFISKQVKYDYWVEGGLVKFARPKKWESRFKLLDSVNADILKASGVQSKQMRDHKSKLDTILIPETKFSNVKLSDAISYFSQVSVALDKSQGPQKGVSIVQGYDSSEEDPLVSLNVKNISLGKALDLLMDQCNYRTTIENEGVLVQKYFVQSYILPRQIAMMWIRDGRFTVNREKGKFGREKYYTEVYQMDRAVFLQVMAELQLDPDSIVNGEGAGQSSEEKSILKFLKKKGIEMEDPNHNFAYDGQVLVMRQTRQTHKLIRKLLRQYGVKN